MTPHLLPLSVLHAAAPGVLDVIFGPDGDFEGAPNWHPPLYGSRSRWGEQRQPRFESSWVWSGDHIHIAEHDGPALLIGAALDLRVPSVAARLALLCKSALEADPRRRGGPNTVRAWHWEWSRAANLYRLTGEAWTEDDAARLAALTVALAPRIAALGGAR